MREGVLAIQDLCLAGGKGVCERHTIRQACEAAPERLVEIFRFEARTSDINRSNSNEAYCLLTLSGDYAEHSPCLLSAMYSPKGRLRMCVACSLAVGLGKVAAENRRIANATALASSQFGRRQFIGGALALAGTAGLAGSALPMLTGCSSSTTKPPSPDGTATMAFINGAVYTMATAQPQAQAVAINGNKIIAVGSTTSVQSVLGPKTTVIDLQGQMLLPGFVEGHTHPFLGAYFTSGVDLQFATLQEALDAITAYVAANPTGPLRGFGWRMDMFGADGPDRKILDAIVSDRPIMLFAIDVHSLWVNSKALEIAGVTSTTPDPVKDFSYFYRDADGNPTGFVLEVQAELMVVNAVEPVTIQTMSTYLQSWFPRAAAAGITTLFDASVPPLLDDEGDIIEIYANFAASGAMPFRVVACHAVTTPLKVDTAASVTAALSKRFNTPFVQARILKIVADGTEEGWTAHMLQPYTDQPEKYGVGSPPFTQVQLNAMIATADMAGIDVHVHACGDATVRAALDAIEAAIKSNPARDRRHTIAHNVLVDDADIPRFAQLNVIAEFSPNWHSHDADTTDILVTRIGKERQAKIYRPNAVLKAGGRISMGTDWPAAGYYSTFKPLDAIQIGVTRKLIGKTDSDPALDPASEMLSLADALAANTIGAAYQLKMESQVGSIEVGKLADLVVLQQNLFNIPASSIASTKIVMSVMDGNVTYTG